MSGNLSKLLPVLIKLSEVDTSLARILAQHKQLEQKKEEEAANANRIKREFEDKNLETEKRRAKYQEEENRISEENQKLVERRKVLSSFSNYKVQQSAQKEIELAAKQLAAQEEKLIVTLEEIENLEKEVAQLKESKESAEKQLKELFESAEGEIEALLARAKEKEEERQQLAASIDPANLNVYERIRNRHIDPLVPIQDGKCGGCFMQISAQMQVQISRADTLVKCRGCGRVLFLDEVKSDKDSSSAPA